MVLGTLVEDVRPFLPAKDFAVSRQFYAALGFKEVWSSDKLVMLQVGRLSFFLQDYFVQEWADNMVMDLRVADVDACWSYLQSLELTVRFPSVVRLGAPHADVAAGVRRGHLVDPSGVLWHFPDRSSEAGALGDRVSRQAAALPDLVARCADAHPNCGVRLQGSVARGTERADSDVDLTIVVPGDSLVRENELLWRDNHWGMQLVHDRASGLRLDINWVGANELIERVAARGAADWFMFLTGRTLRDPVGAVARCEAAIAAWFEAHPTVLSAWQRQQAAVDAFKRDGTRPLEFPTQLAFVRHLGIGPAATHK